MREGVASIVRRNAFRFAMTGIVGIWLSGCADATRFGDGGNPFTNPFANASNSDAGAPTPRVSSAPLASSNAYKKDYAAAARPSPSVVASAPLPAPEATGSIRPRGEAVGGTAAGWTAVGGSPVIVGESDDVGTISRRYGVPEAALLSANGLHSRSDVHANMRIVVPVYNAHGETHVAKAEDEAAKPRHVAKAEDDEHDAAKPRHASKRESADDDSDDDAKAAHKKHKAAKADRDDDDADANDGKAERKVAKKEKSEKVVKAEPVEKPAKPEKLAAAPKPDKPTKAAPQVAKADPPKEPKKPETDKTPTGAVASGAGTATADASASENGQFRWPARGRIIQGFKSGGNDGINIALPEGTSVRAAEDGKVAYAGSALKGYGNLVLIRHSNGFVSAYANNGSLDVKQGETVKRGQVIAKSGATGDVSSPQLHFELRRGQTPVDPTSYLAGL